MSGYRVLEDLTRRDLRTARLGTFAPSLRASDSPIAIACARFLTIRPDVPDLSAPRFISCSARATFAEAFFPYFR